MFVSKIKWNLYWSFGIELDCVFIRYLVLDASTMI